MEPEVRYLILCDDVRVDPLNYHRVDVLGLMTALRATGHPPFPLARPLFCVLVLLTACGAAGQGGDLVVRLIQESTSRIIFRTSPRRIRFVNDPEDTSGAVFRIHNCSFPAGGLYWVECVFAGTVLARQRLSVR
jgi:hypothetical protein